MNPEVYVVGVISDTHGLLRPEVTAAFAGVRLILHAGDVGGAKVLADETLLPRIQAVAATPADAKAVLLAAKGLKINLDPEITIEFTPAK
jgi:hypothetical protein